MIVDDHRMLREGLRRSLEGEGFDVVGEARDGEEAVKLAAEYKPEVILMDVTMPELDGIEATRRIHDEHPEIRIVMLTMHADGETIKAAIKAGAAGYLVKDCSIDEVAEAVKMSVTGDLVLSPDLASTMLDEVRSWQEEPSAGDERLISPREEQVLQLIADGYATQEVAEQLFISHRTVKNHLTSIYQKLEARDRTQAVLQAVRMGIIKLD